jgi:hypothetical protein
MGEQQTHVQLIGDINGRYIVTGRRAGGELTLVPDTSWAAILERSGGRELTTEESAEFWRKYGPQMLASDGEP